jgi:glycogen synthase
MTTQLRILVISNLYPPQVLGGYERSIADFSRLLHHRGHEVLVLTSDTPQFSASHTSQYPDPPVDRCLSLMGGWSTQGTQWFEYDRIRAGTQQNQDTLRQQIQAFQPDVCLAGNLDFLQVETELLKLLLAAEISVAHYVMNANPGYPWDQAPQQAAFCFLTCSNWVTQQLAAANYPVASTRTLYPGADVEAFYQAELPPRDRLRIAYASLVAPYKGADVLIEALSLLHDAGVEFEATIAGGTFVPEFAAALEEFVTAEGMQSKVKFTGALSRQELIELYKTHNVLAFPSRFEEPFGISQIEAMAAGLTLVTSGTGGAGEIVAVSGQDGLLFESENPLDLADVLAALPADPERWRTIAVNGQQRAMTEFSQTKAVEQLEQVFQDLVFIKDSRLEFKYYRIGDYLIVLPLNHSLDRYQSIWKRYDTALGAIAQVVFQKYPQASAIDIGANVGDSAALIRTVAEVNVLCIEGNPEFLPYLEHNASIIGGTEIEACFVGTQGETVNLAEIISEGGTATIVKAVSNPEVGVQTKTLEAITQNYPTFQNAKLLKIDTDGFDFSIIQASKTTLARLRPLVFFEYDVAFTQDGANQGIRTIETLIEIGYEHFIVYDNFGNYLISLSSQDHDRFIDLTAHLVSNRRKSETPAIYYFDICAFTREDADLFEAIRKSEIKFEERSSLSPGEQALKFSSAKPPSSAVFVPWLKANGYLDDLHLTVAIVGSRKLLAEDDYGNSGWSIFAPQLTIYGFDADPEACEIENANLRDRGINWTEQHIPIALGKEASKATLHVTGHPACISLYPPNEPCTSRFVGFQDSMRLVSTTQVEITTLDLFCQSQEMPGIDFLQIDVQGADLDVLQGASQLLSQSILGVVTEVEFVPLYINQPLFADVDRYMRDQGFSLFDLITDNPWCRVTRSISPIQSKKRAGQLTWADACYFRDPLQPNADPRSKQPDRILKLACIADVLEFPDYALELLNYLTVEYGSDPRYNFADLIADCLAQFSDGAVL